MPNDEAGNAMPLEPTPLRTTDKLRGLKRSSRYDVSTDVHLVVGDGPRGERLLVLGFTGPGSVRYLSLTPDQALTFGNLAKRTPAHLPEQPRFWDRAAVLFRRVRRKFTIGDDVVWLDAGDQLDRHVHLVTTNGGVLVIPITERNLAGIASVIGEVFGP